MRQAGVYLYDRQAGCLTEDETGYTFHQGVRQSAAAALRCSALREFLQHAEAPLGPPVSNAG